MLDVKATLTDAEERMDMAAMFLEEQLARIRAGRANVAILDGVRVNSYGSMVPLNQVASVSVPDARTIAIKPWDRKAIRDIEKGIMDSDVGITPENNGEIIRLSIPQPTEERRRDLVKQCNKIGEKTKIEVIVEVAPALCHRHGRRSTVEIGHSVAVFEEHLSSGYGVHEIEAISKPYNTFTLGPLLAEQYGKTVHRRGGTIDNLVLRIRIHGFCHIVLNIFLVIDQTSIYSDRYPESGLGRRVILELDGCHRVLRHDEHLLGICSKSFQIVTGKFAVFRLDGNAAANTGRKGILTPFTPSRRS